MSAQDWPYGYETDEPEPDPRRMWLGALAVLVVLTVAAAWSYPAAQSRVDEQMKQQQIEQEVGR